MLFRIGLENNIEGRSLAWALEHPGCFARGADGDEAMANLPGAVRDYADWIERHGGQSVFDPEQVEIRLEETGQVFVCSRNSFLSVIILIKFINL